MSTKIVYGKYLVIDAHTVIPSGALYIEGDRIAHVGTYKEIMENQKADVIIGSSEHLVTPGFVNAHGHGKGITDFQRGAIDNTLETWKFRTYPHIDPYYDTLWTTIRLIESGVTTTMHNHNLSHPGRAMEEFSTVIEAYNRGGLRLAFAPTLIEKNVFVYGDGEAFIRSASPVVRQLCQQIMDQTRRFGLKEYLQAVSELRQCFVSEQIQVMHGPLSPQWVSDESLQEIKRHADGQGMRIHIHTLQTQLQKIYGLKSYGRSLLEHLDALDFLGTNVTCGHCVWLTDQDIEILAQTGASVTHHASCNLRVRNGIAPVFAMRRKGVKVGIGMDDKELGDDKDFIEEMRLVSKLHRVSSHELESEHLLPQDCFEMGTQMGAQVLGFSSLTGSLESGKRADLVLLDLHRMSEPYVYPDHNMIDLLIYRGRAMDVDTVMVGGEILLKGRQLTKLDREEVVRKLQESIGNDYPEKFRNSNAAFGALKEAVSQYFTPWYQEIEGIERVPYYFVNSKR